MRKESNESFRKCAKKVMLVRKIKQEGNDRQTKLKAAGLTKKETDKLKKETTKMKILDNLKKEGGPFSSADEVDEYMGTNLSDSVKQKRMKKEVKYARDSTRSIPAAGKLFRIMKTDPNTKKGRDLTAKEFSENLKVVLGKQNSRSEVTFDDFLVALWDTNE